jgi:hypothetical protein
VLKLSLFVGNELREEEKEMEKQRGSYSGSKRDETEREKGRREQCEPQSLSSSSVCLSLCKFSPLSVILSHCISNLLVSLSMLCLLSVRETDEKKEAESDDSLSFPPHVFHKLRKNPQFFSHAHINISSFPSSIVSQLKERNRKEETTMKNGDLTFETGDDI